MVCVWSYRPLLKKTVVVWGLFCRILSCRSGSRLLTVIELYREGELERERGDERVKGREKERK